MTDLRARLETEFHSRGLLHQEIYINVALAVCEAVQREAWKAGRDACLAVCNSAAGHWFIQSEAIQRTISERESADASYRAAKSIYASIRSLQSPTEEGGEAPFTPTKHPSGSVSNDAPGQPAPAGGGDRRLRLGDLFVFLSSLERDCLEPSIGGLIKERRERGRLANVFLDVVLEAQLALDKSSSTSAEPSRAALDVKKSPSFTKFRVGDIVRHEEQDLLPSNYEIDAWESLYSIHLKGRPKDETWNPSYFTLVSSPASDPIKEFADKVMTDLAICEAGAYSHAKIEAFKLATKIVRRHAKIKEPTP